MIRNPARLLKWLAFLCLILAGALLPSGSLGAHAHDQDVLIPRKAGPNVPWLRHGSLFVHWYGYTILGNYLYRGKNNQLVAITDIHRFSEMMQEELDNRQEAEDFIRGSLAWELFSFFSPSYSLLIDDEHLKQWKALPKGYDIADSPESLKIVEKYVYAGPKIEGGKWQAHVYFSLMDGGIERWDVDGQVYPFTVDHLVKSQAEKAGATVRIAPAPGAAVHDRD